MFARSTTPWREGVGQGAVAEIQLFAADRSTLETWLAGALDQKLDVGELVVRDFFGIDRGVLVRWAPASASMLCHGGAVITRQLLEHVRTQGVETDAQPVPLFGLTSRYPEARDAIEVCVLDALARCTCPVGIDVLARQHLLWRRHLSGSQVPEHYAADAHKLTRVLRPPLVVATGFANVGKSSLVNALARRDIALVSDLAGTTRDHIGVQLDLDGLVVRWLDTPGLQTQPDAIEQKALDLTIRATWQADLILVCGDHQHGFPSTGLPYLPSDAHTIRVGTRCDVHPVPGVEFQTSAVRRTGLAELAGAVREALLPRTLVDKAARWVFHESLLT